MQTDTASGIALGRLDGLPRLVIRHSTTVSAQVATEHHFWKKARPPSLDDCALREQVL